MAVERSVREAPNVPNAFFLEQGSVFFLGDPSTEYSGEMLVLNGPARFVRLEMIPVVHTRSQGVFVQGRFVEVSNADAHLRDASVFVHPPKK